jgi:hypothetical protein
MKKFLPLMTVLVLVLAIVPSAAAETPPYWTGNPDPMKCGVYKDCRQTVPVCLQGVTQVIGIYPGIYNASPKEIEAAALGYGTVLTAGACQVELPEFIEDKYWGEFWIISDAAGGSPCWYWIDGRYSEKRTQVPSLENIARVCREGFEQDSQVLYIFGTIDDEPMFFNTWTGMLIKMENRPPGWYER